MNAEKKTLSAPCAAESPACAAIADGMGRRADAMKRVADCLLAAVCLLAFSPLFLLCFAAVKCEDGGPAFYAQERVGRGGRKFRILKFRTMGRNAGDDGPKLYPKGIDPRLTRVGRFLSEHHLDELPQLWNVLRGDMAFVGPRPEQAYFAEQIMRRDARYACLYQLRPGVTSYATLYNGYADTIEKMLRRMELDLYYLEHRSWRLDARILWLTFWNIVAGRKF